MPDKVVTIAEYADSLQAEMARQVLDDFGIKAIVLDQNAANLGLPATVFTAKLQVLESDAEQAKQVLEEQQEVYEPEEYEIMDETEDDEPYDPDEEEI